MRDDEFEWHDAKADTNRRNHGVTFEEARGVFDDPNALDQDDPDPDEERYRRTGFSGRRVLVVVYTERGTRIRIISAREAEAYEQDAYYRQTNP